MKNRLKSLDALGFVCLVVALAIHAEESKGAAERFGPAAAMSQLGRATTAPGLVTTLFALEPMVVNPTDMDVDARGRVWVTEGANYRSSFQKWGLLRAGGDRIQILEDTDGDGKADRAKTFYQDMTVNTALGICVLGNRVIVSSAPYVFILTDTDGDDVADKRELIFTTDPRQADHDHAVHAFVFGPDGRLYFNFGNVGGFLRRPPSSLKEIPLHAKLPLEELAKGEIVRDREGIEITDKGKPFRQGMTFRCNLDGSNVEVLGYNFRNDYEVAVDSFGTLWQSDNDDDGNQGVRINYVMEYGNYGYTDEMTGAGWGQKRTGWEQEIPKRHWHLNDPGVVPNLLQTGAGSPTGICVYEGELLPPEVRGQPIHCDAGPRVVRAYPVKPEGAGYSARIFNLLTSEDSWLRPTDVCVAPDGALYVADWNDAGVGGHYMVDQKLETMTGRIYRIAPKGQRPVVPKVDLESPNGAVSALQSPNLATRYLAWNAIRQMGSKAEPDLLKLWKSTNPRYRARALQLLARLNGKTEQYVATALKDSDSDIRITGLRIARAENLETIPLVRQLANDPDPQVRRECLIALHHQKSPDVAAVWAQLASRHDGKDRWYLEALGIGADKNWDSCLDAYLAGHADAFTTAAGRDIIWRSRSKKTPELLVKLINDKSVSQAERTRYLRSLDFVSGPEKEAALLELLSSDTSSK